MSHWLGVTLALAAIVLPLLLAGWLLGRTESGERMARSRRDNRASTGGPPRC